MDETFRTFLAKTRATATEVAAREHLAADVKSVIFDLLQVCEASESAQSEVVGQSSELRLQKKRTEQAKTEAKTFEKRVETLKGFAADLIDAVKTINQAAAGLTDVDAGTRIRGSVQKLAEIIREISKV